MKVAVKVSPVDNARDLKKKEEATCWAQPNRQNRAPTTMSNPPYDGHVANI